MKAHQGSDGRPDSLDLLIEEDRALADILQDWQAAAVSTRDRGKAVSRAWDRGTLGMLLIEHAAIRLAAQEDVGRVLRDLGQVHLADQLTVHTPGVRLLLDRLYDLARGLSARDLAMSQPFLTAVEELRQLIGADASSAPDELGKVRDALGESRNQLRASAFVAKRSPTHPGSSKAWYDRVPFLAYLHARFDRMDSYPGPHTPNQADTALNDKYEPEE